LFITLVQHRGTDCREMYVILFTLQPPLDNYWWQFSFHSTRVQRV